MARAELMLDLAAYKQALQQARQALQAPGQNQPLPPGCLAKTRSSGWYPGLGRPLLDSQPMTVVPPASRIQNLNLGMSPPSPLVEDSPPQTPAPPPGRLASPEPTQPPSSRRFPPWDSSPSSPAKPPALMLAMISLLETMAPYSSQVPDSDFDSLWNLVIQTYSKGC